MKLLPLKKAPMPPPLKLRQLIGPSFILLGMGLGSGELILWPYLTSNYGMGVMWGAVLGITLQFFLNMEIERYTLVTGESIFVGLTRKLGTLAPVWFILSTLLPWIWPGIIASSATLLAAMLGIKYSPIIPILMLILIGIILTLGPVLYKTQETAQKLIIMLGVPFVFILTFIVAKPMDWAHLAEGVVGKGDGFWFFPKGLPMATFLAAFAYAGAGGNLNLAQSLYVKAKGYGMGKFSGQITSIITGKKQNVTLEGTTFENTKENLNNFNIWWKRVNLEHLIVFWATGALTMLVLSLLAYSTVYGTAGNETGINFVINESIAITKHLGQFIGKLFLLSSTIMLFFTQFAVLGSTSRIMCENLALTSHRFPTSKIPIYFYGFLWLQIIAGIVIFSLGFTQPLQLVILGAVLNAFSMFIYSGLLFWLNTSSLSKSTRPNYWRRFWLLTAFLFYGAFSIFTIIQNI